MNVEKAGIRCLVMDVDGTLTDGKIYMGNEGEVCKAFNIKDGCGIHVLLPQAGILPVIITGRSSRILEQRCKEMGVGHVYQGVANKEKALEGFLEEHGWMYENVAYIGDDINDLPCMTLVKERGGLIGCPMDAVQEVIAIADYISDRAGGHGAVREFIEWLIRK